MTREGRVVIFVTIGVGVAAVNTGNNLLYLLLGMLLSVVTLSGVLSELAIWGVKVERKAPERVRSGEMARFIYQLGNQKKLTPSFSLTVGDERDPRLAYRKAKKNQALPVEPWQVERAWFLKVQPGQTEREIGQFGAKRRGEILLDWIRISTRYPFGLFDKWRLIRRPSRLIVHPRVHPISIPEALLARMGHENIALREGQGIEVIGMRDFRLGDEVRSVHGRRSAALGKLVVKERARDEDSWVSLQATLPLRDCSEDELDLYVEYLASLAWSLLERDCSVEILTPTIASPSAHGQLDADPLFDFLALLTKRDLGFRVAPSASERSVSGAPLFSPTPKGIPFSVDFEEAQSALNAPTLKMPTLKSNGLERDAQKVAS